MYNNASLNTHLKSQSVIESQAGIYAEINMNSAENIKVIGNYRNRPVVPETIKSTFVEETASTPAVDAKYFGYTDSDVVVDGASVSDANVPLAYASIDEKKNLLFSLEDCFGRFRPRSGINKAVFYGGVGGHYLHHTNQFMMNRPRYYMPSKNDPFKYWTSFRKEAVTSGTSTVEVERGISNKLKAGTSEWYIDDVAPFIVYKETIPVNRIILKMQTHVGTVDLGAKYDGVSLVTDPLYDIENTATNRSVPIGWKIEYLDGADSTWKTAKAFTSANTPIPRDGYLELQYQSGVWSVATTETTSSTPFFTEFSNSSSSQIMYIKGLRVVVDTMNKKDATFDLIELSPRLSMDITDLTVDYNISKIASDLGVSGMPVGQLLASTGSITIADYDQVLNLNNTASVIAKYVKRNVQIKFFEIIEKVPVTVEGTTTLQSFYVPLKTLYVESFPEIKNETRMASLQLRDLYVYLESLTAPELLITNTSLSYALAMIFDSIGFSNYLYLKSDSDKEPIIPNFFVAPNTTVAQVLQSLAIATQTSMFFDEDNNFVFMSKSYMLANPGDRLGDANAASEINSVLYGTMDSEKTKVYTNKPTTANLANIIEISSKKDNVYNDGKISYKSRYIQKSYTETRQASLIDEEKVWQYKPALLWEVAPGETTKSINEEKASQSAYSLSAIPLNSTLTSTAPTVTGGVVINNTMDLGEGIYWISRYNGYFYANSEIIRYDAVEYSIPQPSQTDILETTANLAAGNVVTVASTATLQVGQKLSKISGDGAFGAGAKVASITNATSFITTVSHSVTGDGKTVKFVGRSAITNYWISSQEEYQKYFARIPFNGKMYPTGRVRIYSEPNYTDDTTLAEGAVARHGRGQFGSTISEHRVGLPSWVTDNTGTTIAGCEMRSELLFNDKVTTSFKISTLTAQPTGPTAKVHVDSAYRKYLRVGQSVSGTGIPSGAKISVIIAQGFKMNKNRTSAPRNVNLTISGINVYDSSLITTETGKSGFVDTSLTKDSTSIAKKSSRTSIIRNFMSSAYYSENTLNSLKSTQTGTIQSSGLVMTGTTLDKPMDFISYVQKDLNDKMYTHFGTRVRIIGVAENNSSVYQTPSGSSDYYSLTSTDGTNSTTIKGASGGIGVLVNRNYNSGYFFEIAALSVNNTEAYGDTNDLFNVVFYKTKKETGSTDIAKSIPIKLWTGRTNILVDDGRFTGQYRVSGETNPTVYDLAVEYEVLKDGALHFYLYINNRMVGSVIDTDPIPATHRQNNLSLFVRGSSKLIFENAYALKPNESANYVNASEAVLNGASSINKEYEVDDAFRRYALPEAIQNTYLSKLSPIGPRGNDLYFEEFGTIMRECAYFDIKYDKAYPTLYAKIAPTFNKLRGYAVSGFVAGAYGAEFLIFNTTDKAISLDSSSGNYLRILGVTFTQESTHDYSVDEYFQQKADLSDPAMYKNTVTNQPLTNKRNYLSIKNSRMTYGNNEFNISSDYIQSQDAAEDLMGWMISKIMQPRISAGISIFPNPALQLGDIVTINYKTGNTLIDEIAGTSSRFVIYNIEYSRNSSGPTMTIYVSQIASEVAA
jgi:hypothetical protein